MQIQKWLKQGICRPSNSTYAAPAFIVEQPFHESTPRRVVIDYSRTINFITKLDPHPIDHMEDVIKRIVGKCYISKMDVKSTFNTIGIRETDIKTGFITPDGHYEFLRMPFGVTNGPSTMTRAIKLAYEHLAPHNVNTYNDDISTSHDDFSNHLKVLYKILEATRNAGFKLRPGKTQLAVSEIALFGRILSQEGERPDPDRTASVQRYSILKSIHEARSFLGFANQFRKHIQNYAVIAKPLTSVLKGLERKISNATIILTDDQQRTFETLKTAITTAPILAYFKQGLPTFLETDASYSGLGALLSQDKNGKRRVIKYVSRTLKDAETRYHSNELECTAVHWALTEKFRLYLLGHKFQLITDNYATADVVTKSAVNRKFARYLVDLARFDSTTVRRPGKQNVIIDHLSRFPTPPVCLTVTVSYQSKTYTKQKQDDFCQYIFRLLKEQNPNKKTMSIISNYNIDNNTLVRVKEKSKYFAVVIPKAMREQTLIACHDDVGHMDAKKTLHNLKQRYWWPNMRKDCKNYVRSCHKCQVVNRSTANAYGLLQQLPIPTTPWEIVSADHVICLPQTRAGNTNMIVRIDHATRYVVATPSASLGAHSVTDALYHNILRYGPPIGTVCYEIKSRTLQNKFIKVVHVQHLRPYFKRDADLMQNNTSDEENDSSAENQDPAEDHQEISVTTEPSSSRNHLRRNRRPP
ncbi:hypothetical protein TNCV_4166191 [Trichonephila clavipes]|nr:hypothetical protein TNCV_4166191 [Trichonephila clavipes]